MQNAKRMVLVEEKLLDYLQTKQDASWKRPTEEAVKTSISKEMKSVLNDPTVPDDVKVKRYRQDLGRFLRAKRKLPLAPKVDNLLDIKPVEKIKIKSKRKVIDTKAKRTSKRVSKKPKRYADFEWETWK